MIVLSKKSIEAEVPQPVRVWSAQGCPRWLHMVVETKEEADLKGGRASQLRDNNNRDKIYLFQDQKRRLI
jgi:hypothetical protein